jgi:hypothetical protein
MYQWQYSEDGETYADIESATESTYTVDEAAASDAGYYRVQVSNGGGEMVSNVVQIWVLDAPSITSGLADTNAIAGDDVTLSITADVAGTASYQWYKDDAAIEGATEATLQLTNVTGDDSGDYSVDVSNEVATVTSAASLTVIEKPVITRELADKMVNLGGGVFFTVTATSDAPLTYAWYLNDELIEGQTSHVFNVSHVTLNDLGTYRVDVTNDAGTVSSSAVVSLVGNTLQPGDGPGALVGSTIVSSDANSTTYQSNWFGTFTIASDSEMGWVESDSLGWVYFSSISTPQSAYIYPLLVDQILYTNSTLFPRYAYSYRDSSWIFLPSTNDPSTGAIWGWVYATSEWVKYAHSE